MTEPPRYYGSTYCCPACGTAFTLIRPEITGCGLTDEPGTLRCPACRTNTALRVTDTELITLTRYIKLRTTAHQIIRTKTAAATTHKGNQP